MIKKICICDRCREETASPVRIGFLTVEMETGDLVSEAFGEEAIDLCPACSKELHAIATGMQVPPAVPAAETGPAAATEPAAEPKPAGTKPVAAKGAARKPRERIDVGKIKALRDAGWARKDIAGEMGLTPKQVTQALYLDSRKESKKMPGAGAPIGKGMEDKEG